MIDHISPEKYEHVVKNIQWEIRNMYKDIGFARSDAQRQTIRNACLSSIEDIIAEAEE